MYMGEKQFKKSKIGTNVAISQCADLIYFYWKLLFLPIFFSQISILFSNWNMYVGVSFLFLHLNMTYL